MASFNQRAIKWVDYIKENCIDALKKYCEDQASNDLTAEEKQDARDYLENYIKTEVTKYFGCGVDESKDCVKNRNIVEKKMSPSQIEKAQEMARNWKPKK